jgi:Ca2+-transporting ATPase
VQSTVLANELVPGDLITFSTGDRVPADVRIATSVDLEIDESSLTGETTARRKDGTACGAVHVGQEPVALAERTCIAYMGTLVRNGMSQRTREYDLGSRKTGRGSGIVIATGKDTEFGVIFSMMEDVRVSVSLYRVVTYNRVQVEEKRTPLQLSMDELAKKLSIISFGIIGVICLLGVVQQRSWLEMFTIGGGWPPS